MLGLVILSKEWETSSGDSSLQIFAIEPALYKSSSIKKEEKIWEVPSITFLERSYKNENWEEGKIHL
jgi:hypothetical protein